MPFDQGIDFRATAGFVTDPASCDKEIGTTANYPRTSAQGNTVGWEDAPGGTRDRTNSVDARLAGIAFAANGTAKRYRIDLPSSGYYRITLALGDNTTAQSQSVGVYDSTTLLSNVVGHNLASAAGTFYDACGIRRSSAANWVSNEVSFVAFFSSTICRIKIADTATASGNSSIAHVRVTADSAPSPSFNCGIDFRGTSAFVTDPTNCSPQINNFADYPHINAQGIVCGWEDAPNTFSDRSAAIDARLAGINAVAAGSTARFRIDLPASGAYRIEAAVGDATTAQPASGGSPAQRVEVFDGLTSLGTLVNNRQTPSGQWYDGSDTVRTSAANWVSGEAASTWTFTGTTLRLKCGIAAGGAGSTTLSHVKVTQLTGLAGTSSLSATLRLLRRFTATLAGVGHLTATIPLLRRFTATVAGVGHLTATVIGFRRFTATITGVGHLTASITGLKRFTGTLAGRGSLTATSIGAIRRIVPTLAGSSTLSATVTGFKRFTATLSGKGTLTATVTSGGTTQVISATLTGQGSLRAQPPYFVPSMELVLGMYEPIVSPEQVSMALHIGMNTPTIISGSPVPSMVMQLGMFTPTVAGPQQFPASRMTLGMKVPAAITPAQLTPMVFKIGMNTPTITPYAVPSMKLTISATPPAAVTPIQAPATMILNLLADAPDIAFATFLILSGVLKLGMFTPTVTAYDVPPPQTTGPGIHLAAVI